MIYRIIFTIVFFVNILKAFSQGNLIILNERDNWNICKSEIYSNELMDKHTSIKPYFQHRILDDLQDIKEADKERLLLNNYEYIYYKSDSLVKLFDQLKRGSSLLKYFNTHPGHFYSAYNKNFYLVLDPLINISFGKETFNGEKILNNTRGIRLRVGIDNRVFLFSDILENQVSPLSYVQDFTNLYKAYPGAGFTKRYTSKILKINKGFDFLIAEGGVNFRATKHIDVTLAHSKNFVGQGIRSLLLSDSGPPAFFLRLNTQLGIFNYQNIFSELSSENRFINDIDKLLIKKYLASHYLSVNITKNWNLGLFESVIFNRNKGFELQYLNPIILYRAIEQAVGSPDNVLIGMQSHLNIAMKISLYGQVILDEFVLSRVIKNNEGWWANKYGFQIGLKYPEVFGIKKLNFQTELNIVRPFTYSYSDSSANYSHYNQAIAHPLGSNFRELIGRVNYCLGKKTFFQVQYMIYNKGLDTSGINLGGNILKSNSTRAFDFQNTILQGLNTRIGQIVLQTSYEIFPRTYFDLNLGVRQSKNSLQNLNSKWIEIGIRMNLDSKTYEF